MPTDITMPQLGESVAEGTIGHWLKHEGDMVQKDESLVEIVTDKVTAELPSPVAGRLVTILVHDDETARVGAPIGQIEESEGANTVAGTSGAAGTAGAASMPQHAGTRAAGGLNGDAGGAPARGGAATLERNDRQERVSPLARRMAQEHAVDLAQIEGSGEGGRVRKEDILAYVAARQPAPTAAPSAPPAPGVAAGGGDQIITPSPARRAIAEHMVRSKRTSPHATTVFEVDMTNLARWLERHKAEFKQREGYGISYQTFVIKAAAEALRAQPYANASWTEDGKIILRKQINIGISIALENNLIVPVIRDADQLSLAGIARAAADLVNRVRARRLLPADTQGATFTVNNPGVFGTMISVAIINQPNAAILTMDGVVKRPVVVDDAIAIRHMMYMSLSFDHRVLDGLVAAQFLAAVKRRLESWGPEIDCY